MRFDWEPRPVPEGLKQIERNQRHQQSVSQLQAGLDQQARWSLSAHWQDTSQRKAALVQHTSLHSSSVDNDDDQTSNIKPPRPLVADLLKAEEEQRKQAINARKTEAAHRRAQQLEAARLLALEEQQRHSANVAEKLDRLFTLSCDELRVAAAKSVNISLASEQQYQALYKEQQLNATKQEEQQKQYGIYLNQAEIEAAERRRQHTAKQLVESPSQQLDEKDRQIDISRQCEQDSLLRRRLEIEAQEQEEIHRQHQEEERRKAATAYISESNKWQKEQQEKRIAIHRREDAVHVFDTLLKEQQAEQAAVAQKHRHQQDLKKYQDQLDAELDARQTVTATEDQHHNIALEQLNIKEDTQRAVQEHHRLKLQQEADEYNSHILAAKQKQQQEAVGAKAYERKALNHLIQQENDQQAARLEVLSREKESLKAALWAQSTAKELETTIRQQQKIADKQAHETKEQEYQARIQRLMMTMPNAQQ